MAAPSRTPIAEIISTIEEVKRTRVTVELLTRTVEEVADRIDRIEQTLAAAGLHPPRP